MSLKMIKDGVSLAINEIKPPACPDGWERDKENPYKFHIIVPNCKHRTNRTIKKENCNCTKSILYCILKDMMTTKMLCAGCNNYDNS